MIDAKKRVVLFWRPSQATTVDLIYCTVLLHIHIICVVDLLSTCIDPHSFCPHLSDWVLVSWLLEAVWLVHFYYDFTRCRQTMCSRQNSGCGQTACSPTHSCEYMSKTAVSFDFWTLFLCCICEWHYWAFPNALMWACALSLLSLSALALLFFLEHLKGWLEFHLPHTPWACS